jgi:hypothetical protein
LFQKEKNAITFSFYNIEHQYYNKFGTAFEIIVAKYKISIMKKITLLLLTVVFFALVSCKKDNTEPTSTQPTTTDQLVVPASFDWKTTHEVQFNLRGFANSMVEITSEEGVVYLKLGLKKDQPVSVKLALPTYQTTVVLKYLGQSIPVDVTGSTVSHTFTINSK